MKDTVEYRAAVHVILQLNMVSQVSGRSLEASSRSSETSRTGNRPPGGVDRFDDRQPDFRQKSAEHFRRRLNGCRCVRDVRLVLEDAELALDAWRRTPLSGDPLPGDPFFKRWVREHDASDSELARLTGVSRQYINRIRQQAA